MSRDSGKKIARICRRSSAEPRLIPLEGIRRMGEMALSMLDEALGALAAHNAENARRQMDDFARAAAQRVYGASK